MSDISDKSIIQLLGMLKPGDLWKLIVAFALIIAAVASGGFYMGTKKAELELNSCKLILERRTNLLSEAFRQSAGSLHDRIEDELRSTGGIK